MKFFQARSPEFVTNLMDEFAADLQLETEEVNIENLADRVVAKDIISKENVPEFHRSTVDGYAIKCANAFGASQSIPAIIEVVGSVEMGKETHLCVEDYQGVYVPTGGMLPQGSDGMLMIEDSELLDPHTLAVNKSIAVGANIIYKGDDIKSGDKIISKGTRLSPNHIGVLAALGLSEITVYKPLKVVVYSTGDEIIPVDEAISLGKVRDINGYVLKNMLKKIGVRVLDHKIIKDDYQDLLSHVKKGLEEADLVLLSGGSSVGVRDFTHQVIESFEDGEILVHGITVKPGKPTIIGRVNKKPLIGLPGHPVSSIMIYKAFIEPYILKVSHQTQKSRTLKGRLETNVHSSPGKRTYQMVQVTKDHGLLPFYGKSGMISLLAGADGYIIIENDIEGLEKGTEVDVFLFD